MFEQVTFREFADSEIHFLHGPTRGNQIINNNISAGRNSAFHAETGMRRIGFLPHNNEIFPQALGNQGAKNP